MLIRCVKKHYSKGSPDRKALEEALGAWKTQLEVSAIIDGKEVRKSSASSLSTWSLTSQQVQNLDKSFEELQPNPADYNAFVARYNEASPSMVSDAIERALAAKPAWEAMPFADKAAIFLKAADLIGGKYRYKIMAATILGQGKNAWQAEIDAAAELCDFLR